MGDECSPVEWILSPFETLRQLFKRAGELVHALWKHRDYWQNLYVGNNVTNLKPNMVKFKMSQLVASSLTRSTWEFGRTSIRLLNN